MSSKDFAEIDARVNGKVGVSISQSELEELTLTKKQNTTPQECGFTIGPNHISYTANTVDWLQLARVFNRIDEEIWEEDIDRMIFDMFRAGLLAAAEASFMAYHLSDDTIRRTKKEMEEMI